jgi:hypothetical protein
MPEDFSLNSNSVRVTKRVKKSNSAFSNWLIEKKIVKTHAQASLVLIGIIALSVLLIVILNWPSSQATLDIDEKYYQDVILDE